MTCRAQRERSRVWLVLHNSVNQPLLGEPASHAVLSTHAQTQRGSLPLTGGNWLVKALFF
jgi:hypothetical protein